MADVRELLFSKPTCDLDPFCIQKTLCDVWHDFQAAHEDETCSRLCTMNLVVICNSPNDAVGLSEELESVSCLYPGRIVMVVLDQEYGGPIEAWYRFETSPKHPAQLGSEWIGIHCSADGKPLPSLLATLWKEDLPNFLWWRGTPPYEESWVRYIMESSHRIILDSGCHGVLPRPMGDFRESLAPMRKIHELITHAYHQELLFSDLNWNRLQSWREWLAGLFDAPERLQSLGSLQQIEIVTWSPARDITPSILAMYIAGWLAHQLRLKMAQPCQSDGEGYRALLDGSWGRVEVLFRFAGCKNDSMVARLTRVSFSGPGYRWAVERCEDRLGALQRQVSRVLDSAPESCKSSSLELANLDARQMLSIELDSHMRDATFEAALAKALEFCPQGVVCA
jgi:hypothetical protein